MPGVRHGGISTSVVLATRLLGACVTAAGFLNSMWSLCGLISGSAILHITAVCWGLAICSNYFHCSWCGTTVHQELKRDLLLMRLLLTASPVLGLLSGDVGVVLSVFPLAVPFVIVLVGALRSMGSLQEMLDSHWSDSGVCDAVVACVGLTACIIYAGYAGDACWGMEKSAPLLIAFCCIVGANIVLTQALFQAQVQLWQELDGSNQLRRQLEVELGKSRQLGSELEQELQKGDELRNQLHASLQEVSGKLALTRLAVSRIVAGVCDCVFKLDNDLRVSDASPALVDLVRAGSASQEPGVLGWSIDSFMSPADAERVRKAFAVSSDGAHHGVAAALPLELVDACARPIPVEMYHTRLDETEHIVVLRLRNEDVSTSGSGSNAAGHLAAVACGSDAGECPSQSSASPQARLGAGASAGAALGGERAEAHMIVIDAGTPDLEVVKCSRLFKCAGLGHAPCGLLNFVPHRIGRALDSWIYDEVQRASCARTPRSRKSVRSLTLDLPPSPGVQVEAQSAWLEFDGLERFDADVPVALRLSGVRVRTGSAPPAKAMATIQEDESQHQADSPQQAAEADGDEDEEDEDADNASSVDNASSINIRPDDSISLAGSSFRMD